MENSKFTRWTTILLATYSFINLLLIGIILITRHDMNSRIDYLERKIEVLEIHIFPEDFSIPPEETHI